MVTNRKVQVGPLRQRKIAANNSKLSFQTHRFDVNGVMKLSDMPKRLFLHMRAVFTSKKLHLFSLGSEQA